MLGCWMPWWGPLFRDPPVDDPLEVVEHPGALLPRTSPSRPVQVRAEYVQVTPCVFVRDPAPVAGGPAIGRG
jgi:hypothetical protein